MTTYNLTVTMSDSHPRSGLNRERINSHMAAILALASDDTVTITLTVDHEPIMMMSEFTKVKLGYTIRSGP